MNFSIATNLARYNKAAAAAGSQAVVQMVAAFVRFPPELEQAIGIIMTSLMVWLVPNQGKGQAAKPEHQRMDRPLVAHLPVPTALAAVAMTLFLAGCASMISGDSVADRMLGPDCGPESRVFRARSLMVGLGRAYPAMATEGMSRSLANMETAAANGQSLELPAAAFHDALVAAIAPIVLHAGMSGEPIWLSLAQLPPVAAQMVLVRQQQAAFCAGA